jgi:TonB family protein
LAVVIALGWCMISAAQQQGTLPIHVSGQDAEAHLLQRTYPMLPASAQSVGIQGGTVGVEVTISPLGNVSSVRRIIGDPTLGEAASEAVRGWKYRPFLDNGIPVEVVAVQTVEFRTSPPSRKPFVIGWSLFGLLCFLVALPWIRLLKSNGQHLQLLPRNWLFLAGLTMLTISLLQLVLEFVYRYGLKQPLWFAPESWWVIANGWMCLVAAVLCLIGKGAGKWASLAAVPLLYFFWAIHVAV